MAAENPNEEKPRSVTVQALKGALRKPLLWGVVWLAFTLLALLGALPWLAGLEDAVGDRYERGALVTNLDVNFLADHAQLLDSLERGAVATGALLGLAAILLQVFFAGGWLQVFLERAQGAALQRFALGGSRHFFRFLRLAFLTVGALALASWIVHGEPWELLVDQRLLGLAKPGDYEALASEWTATQVQWAQAGLFGLLVALIFTWGDYTRTRLALRGSTSALWAGIATFFALLLHPLRTLRPMLALFLVEALVVALGAVLVTVLEDNLSTESTAIDVLVVLLVSHGVLAWSIVTRGARYHAALAVSRDLLKPAPPPDPEKETLGGPGGPRYPIDAGDDEYGVAL